MQENSRGVASIWLSGLEPPLVSAKVGGVGPTVYWIQISPYHRLAWQAISWYIKFTTKMMQNTKDKFEYLLVSGRFDEATR
jgi:hypothetical protein